MLTLPAGRSGPRPHESEQAHRGVTMNIEVHGARNAGVITQFDSVAVECCQTGSMTIGTCYLASGGCAVVECGRCGILWRFMPVPTQGIGPIRSATENPRFYDQQPEALTHTGEGK